MKDIQPVILCGGSGTRLWPLSRGMQPKQVLGLTGEKSLLFETCRRLRKVAPGALDPIAVCNEVHRFLVRDELRAAGCAEPKLVLEPSGHNTAPAISLVALLHRDTPEKLLLVLPADHVLDEDALSEALVPAAEAARKGDLLTLGIQPTRPETGYGYIRPAANVAGPVRPVEEFVEKPDAETAKAFLESGAYVWNSGMFLFSIGTWLEELEKHAPDILEICQSAAKAATRETDFIRPDPDIFRSCPSDSIDCAVMERTDRASCVALDGQWSDVGTWDAVHGAKSPDEDGNVTVGDVVAIACSNSYLRSESRLVGAVGLDNCVVIETKDAVLVAPRDRSQDVKDIVEELKRQERPEADLGREVFRPWGSYDSLDKAGGYQVKRLTVLPGAVLSLQSHSQRAEHWVVVTGHPRITRGDEVFDLEPNQYAFIPVGEKHRIENPGNEIVHIIEVQVGDYLGEDDIVRFDDQYGRAGRTD